MINSSAIDLKGPAERDRMREAGAKLAEVHRRVLGAVRPGVTTGELDRIAADTIAELDCRSAFLGYHGFPATICSSVNEEIVHGIPSDKCVLQEGDIVGIDIGLVHDGFYSDRATTMPVGRVKPEVMRLLQVTNECLNRAIAAVQEGSRLHDIGRAIQELAEENGYGIVREYSGHGIGRRMHESPQVPNYVPERGSGMRGGNPRLRTGMTLAIEPMINRGTWKTKVLDDKWTVVTADGLPSAHFEHTVLLTEEGPEILTGEQPDLSQMELDSQG